MVHPEIGSDDEQCRKNRISEAGEADFLGGMIGIGRQTVLFLLDGAKKVGYGERDDENPMGSHDVHFVDGKGQTDVQGHIKKEYRHEQPQVSVASSACYAGCKQQDDECLHQVLRFPSVSDDERPACEHVAQDVLPVQLDGLSEEVLHDDACALRSLVGPPELLLNGIGNLGRLERSAHFESHGEGEEEQTGRDGR